MQAKPSGLAVGAAIALSAAYAAEAHAGSSITVRAKEFAFEPARIEADPGEPIQITFANTGAMSHNLSFKTLDGKTETIQAGARDSITVTPPSGGTYIFVCTVPGHAQAGMKGKLVVE